MSRRAEYERLCQWLHRARRKAERRIRRDFSGIDDHMFNAMVENDPEVWGTKLAIRTMESGW